jgi:hypothetical protein
MIRLQDLAANEDKIDLSDFSTAMLATLFVALGSDYCRKLKGIGLTGASKIVRSAFLDTVTDTSGVYDPLSNTVKKLLEATWDLSLTKEDKKDYTKCFLEGIFMFRHPVVYDPVKHECRHMGDPDCSSEDKELRACGAYVKLCKDKNRREQITGDIIESNIASYIAEGYFSAKTRQQFTVKAAPVPILPIVTGVGDTMVSVGETTALTGDATCTTTGDIEAPHAEESSDDDDDMPETMLAETQMF